MLSMRGIDTLFVWKASEEGPYPQLCQGNLGFNVGANLTTFLLSVAIQSSTVGFVPENYAMSWCTLIVTIH
jgi:hypothetical protein